MSVYDKHRAHTARIGASVILFNGEHVANITIAFPRDGASRLYAYVHWIGTEMQRGHANGYGYDKRTAAVSSAARKRLDGWDKKLSPQQWHDAGVKAAHAAECSFWEACALDNGPDWTDNLRNAGFTVCRVC